MGPSGRASSSSPQRPSLAPAAVVGSQAAVVADFATIAAAICDAAAVMLIRVAGDGATCVVHAQGFGAEGVAATPPQPETLLRLARSGPDAEVIRSRIAVTDDPGAASADRFFCAVTLRDAASHVIGLLCVLCAHPVADAAVPAMRALGRPLAAVLLAERAENRLAECMTELAWECDADGGLLWCNRAFAERFCDGDARGAFLARWHAAGGEETGRALVPAWMGDDGAEWFETRSRQVSGQWPGRAGSSRLGLALPVSARIDGQIELARLGPLREVRGPTSLPLARALPGMVERIRLVSGCDLRIEPAGDEELVVLCDPHLLESALLDAALACAAVPGALVLALSSGPSESAAVLTLTHTLTHDPFDQLPMLRPLLQAGGRAETFGAPWAPGGGAPGGGAPGGGASGLRLLLPLHRPAGTEPHDATTARILVVDDEAVVRMLVVDLLRERGHTVQEAEDAFAAMAMVQEGAALDLMITDIGLPGGFDGSTLARRTRLLRPGLPILFITGYAFGTNNDVTLEPGIPVLTKPFTLGALSSRIAELLSPESV